MSDDNYAPGTRYDPDAPWNQVEPEYEECDACGGHGSVADDGDDQYWTCEECDGAGEVVIVEEGDY